MLTRFEYFDRLFIMSEAVQVKVTARKGIKYYVHRATSIVTSAASDNPVRLVVVSALGNAVSTAVELALQLERRNLAKIIAIETDYKELESTHSGDPAFCGKIDIRLTPCMRPDVDSGLRVIFLDIDGVLHSVDNAAELFNVECMKRLQRIVEGVGAVIVLSSSWRLIPHELEKARAQLKLFGMCIHDCTSQRIGSTSRVNEICEWLHEHKAEVMAFAAIDDSDLSDGGILRQHWVQTRSECGLVERDVDLALSALRGDGDCSSPEVVLERWERWKDSE